MTITYIIWDIFRVCVAIGLAFIFFGIIAMGVYDVQKAKEIQRLKRDKSYRYRTRFRKKPAVTILVPAYNEELVIERCLESLSRVAYRRFKIVVVSDGSKDRTTERVRNFIKTHTNMDIRLVDLRKNRGKGGALNYVLKHYCDTELFMVLDADCTLKCDALKKAVEYFKDPLVMGLAANVRVAEQLRPLSYLQKIEYLVGYGHKKFFSITNSEFIIGGQGATYRTGIVKSVNGFDEIMLTEDIALSLSIAHLGNKSHRLVYASDVITYTEAPHTLKSLYRQRYRWKMGAMQALFIFRGMVLSRSKSHSRMLTFMRIPQALIGEATLIFEPILLAVFIGIILSTHSLMVFFGGWFTLTIYTMAAILADEYSTRKERAIMLAIMPFMYPLFYIFTVINVIAMFQCIKNWRKVVGKDITKGSWQSPARIGHQISA